MNIKDIELIVVHSMGKVGSTSIEKTLKEMNLDIPIYHTHFLNHDRLESHIKRLKDRNSPILEHLKVSQHLTKELSTGPKNKKWKIVTLVRDPIARNISAFFENGDKYYSNFLEECQSGKSNVELLTQDFMRKYAHDIPLTWLDEEIKKVFGIDPFLENFPLEKGYYIMSKNNFELMIIKLENLNSCYITAFKEFLEISIPKLNNQNIASKKKYATAYEKFKKSIVIPNSYIEKMYDSKFMKHFYSLEEIDLLTQKWKKS